MNHIARLALAAVSLVACQDIHAPDTTSPQRLQINLPQAISPKQQYSLQVTAYTRTGLPLAPPPVMVWSSTDESVATVDANGIVTGHALGYTTIAVVAGGLTGFANLQVRPAGLRITMTPENTMKFYEFMHKVGMVKPKAASWKDLYFPEVHNLPGS